MFRPLALLFALLLPLSAHAVDAGRWKKIDELESDQKLQAALDLTQKVLAEAERAHDEPERTRAMIEIARLQLGLSGVETAVKTLRAQKRPSDVVDRALVDLYYAQTLLQYFGYYRYEILRREEQGPREKVDLKAWTAQQLREEINAAYLDAWKHREALGQIPQARAARYLELGDYPQKIRDTLRDAVGYLWVEMLDRADLWTPEEGNALYSLDFPRLLAGGAEAKLDDPGVHPLVKLGAVLSDLERWHLSAGQRAAALEARIVRDERLHARFDRKDQRKAIVDDLEHHLAAARELSWFAWGKSVEARLIMGPGDLVRAREVALEGERAYPKSVGGKRCLSLVKSIEAPSLSVVMMSSDGPRKRSIQITYSNLRRIYLRAYRFDLKDFLGKSRDYNLLPDRDQALELLRHGSPVAQWQVPLPATPDYRQHLAYDVPPLTQAGDYVLIASARADFSIQRNVLPASNFLLTGIVLRARQLPSGGVEAQVLDAESGAPIRGGEVVLYRYDYKTGHTIAARANTDAEGSVQFPPVAPANFFLTASRGSDFAIDTNYWYLGGRSPEKEKITRALVFTDRLVYRPNQDVRWKVVAYDGVEGEGSFRAAGHQAVTVRLVDANGQEVVSKQVTTDDFGSAAGRFTIPAGRLLGDWRVEAVSRGSAGIKVEEYKRPTFEVTIASPKQTLRINRPATFEGKARYYFGLPVPTGKVSWRVYREPLIPFSWFWFRRPTGARELIAGGDGKLSPDGGFTVTFTPKADERNPPEWGYRYSLEADVTDEGGETRSGSKSFALGKVAVQARIDPEHGFLRAGKDEAVRFVRTDLDGTPRAGEASYWVDRLVPPTKARMPADLPMRRSEKEGKGFHTPGDLLRPRWSSDYSPEEDLLDWKDGARIAGGALRHGEDGKAEARVTLPPGAFRIHYRTQDRFGATFDTEKDVLVVDHALEAPVAAALIPEEPSVEVGQTAHLLVASGFPGQPYQLSVLRDDKVIDHRWVTAGQGSAVLDLPVTEAMRGGFSVTLSVLRDHQAIRLTTNVIVPWSDKSLKLEFATFRDRLRPGGHETWKVKVSRPDGRPVEPGAAQVLAFMYDRALDLFGEFAPPDVASIYPSHFGRDDWRLTLGSSYASSLTYSSWYSVPEAPELEGAQLKDISPYGIGGPGRRRFGGLGMMRADAMPSAPPPSGGRIAAQARVAAKPAERAMEKKAGLAAAPAAPAPTPALRTNFAETAFWQPSLVTGADGSVEISFQVPDSVTSWNVWVEAITRDLVGGQLHRTAESAKPLMVRPYLPRFLRVGDRAAVKVVVNNASKQPLSGTVRLEVIDPKTKAPISDAFGLTRTSAPFTAKPDGSANAEFLLTVPPRLGEVAIRAVAEAPGFSDGELRPIPVLPSRIQLTQSRFVTLHGSDTRTLSFPDLARSDDPTRRNEQLVVTIDAQLFYSLLDALPYLVNYPYECTEQTLNRFVSTGILSTLYQRYPGVAKVAKELSRRTTPLETFDSMDPNRKLALEETPWLVEAKGGPEGDYLNVLDPRIAEANRVSALEKLRKSQTAIGGFPWWPGGPPSPYMTAYLMYGFAKAASFGVPVPKDMVQRGWAYLAMHYREAYGDRLAADRDFEFLTFLNFVASSYPDPSWMGDTLTQKERERMLEVSFRHWKEHSPYLKSMLAMTLVRMGRKADAQKVFGSVMDSAKTDRDLGTFWQPEDRAWLWYRDTIETQAFALRALMEVFPEDPRAEGLVQWLMLNKKLNHWESTRATAEVLSSVATYLEKHHQLGVEERISVKAPPRDVELSFSPEHYTGKKNHVVVAGPEVSAKDAEITVSKSTPGLAFASASWTFSTEKPPAHGEGDLFQVSRRYFQRVRKGKQMVLAPLTDGTRLSPGDEIEVRLSLRAKHEAEYVQVHDPRAAGFEPEELTSGYRWDLGLPYYEEIHDSATDFFFEMLPVGEYTFHYRVRVASPGTFRIAPTTVQSMYAPEFNAYSAGATVTVAE